MVLAEPVGLSMTDVDVRCRVPSHTALFPYLARRCGSLAVMQRDVLDACNAQAQSAVAEIGRPGTADAR